MGLKRWRPRWVVGSRYTISVYGIVKEQIKDILLRKIKFMVPEEQRVELWPPHTQVYPNKHANSLLYTP